MIRKEIIGNPKVCAIEFALWHFDFTLPYGGVKLWLEGKYIGDIDEGTYLTMPPIQLKQVIASYYKVSIPTKDTGEIPKISKSVEEFIKLRDDSIEDENKKWGIGLIGPTFDFFCNVCFRQGAEFIFYWCLSPEYKEFIEFHGRLQDFPDEVQRAEVKIDLLNEIINKYEARIKEIDEEHKALQNS